MTQRNRAAIDIDFAGIPLHFLIDRSGLGGESLVDFHQIQFIGRPTCFAQGFARSIHRPHAHDGGVDCRTGVGLNRCQWG